MQQVTIVGRTRKGLPWSIFLQQFVVTEMSLVVLVMLILTGFVDRRKALWLDGKEQ